MQQIKPMEPQRNREGYWTHPDYPDTESTAQFDAWQSEQGLQCSVVMLDGDSGEGSKDAQHRYFEEDDADILAWQPSKPEGEGWFIVSIHDTEHGPVCVWVRPNAGDSKFSTNYPQWRTKDLRTAFKIGQLNYAPDGACVISPEDPALASVSRTVEWCEESRPRVGGYMVKSDAGWHYRDGDDFEIQYVKLSD